MSDEREKIHLQTDVPLNDLAFPIVRIISGGQTGVDRAALDFALQTGIACGGWCPKGRGAEDGPIGLKYPLKETPSSLSAKNRVEYTGF